MKYKESCNTWCRVSTDLRERMNQFSSSRWVTESSACQLSLIYWDNSSSSTAFTRCFSFYVLDVHLSQHTELYKQTGPVGKPGDNLLHDWIWDLPEKKITSKWNKSWNHLELKICLGLPFISPKNQRQYKDDWPKPVNQTRRMQKVKTKITNGTRNDSSMYGLYQTCPILVIEGCYPVRFTCFSASTNKIWTKRWQTSAEDGDHLKGLHFSF